MILIEREANKELRAYAKEVIADSRSLCVESKFLLDEVALHRELAVALKKEAGAAITASKTSQNGRLPLLAEPLEAPSEPADTRR